MIDQQESDPTNSRSLVTVASNAARVPRAEFGAYGASKASAARVTSSFGLQLAAHGIRVNSVCPGTTRTPMVTDAWEGRTAPPCPWLVTRGPSAWAFRWAASPIPLILRRSTPSSSRRLPATSRCRRLSPTAAPPSKLQLTPLASVRRVRAYTTDRNTMTNLPDFIFATGTRVLRAAGTMTP